VEEDDPEIPGTGGTAGFRYSSKLQEDEGSSTKLSLMEMSGLWPMLHKVLSQVILLHSTDRKQNNQSIITESAYTDVASTVQK